MIKPSISIELAKLHALCFSSPRPWNAEEFSSLLDQEHCFLIRNSDGFAIGRAIAGEAELLTLAVHPDSRRNGSGSALLAEYEYEARAKDSEDSFLEVSKENLGAIAFYLGANYRESGVRRNYYRTKSGVLVDALVLRKTLIG